MNAPLDVHQAGTDAVALAFASAVTTTTAEDLSALGHTVAKQSDFMVACIRKQAGDYTPPAIEYTRQHGLRGARAHLDATIAELRAAIIRNGRIALDLAALV